MRASKCVGLHWKAVATFTLFRRFTPFLSFLLLFSCVQKLISVITTFNLQLWLMWDVLQNSDASWKCPQSCWAHRPSTGEDLKRPPHHSSVPRGCQRSRPGCNRTTAQYPPSSLGEGIPTMQRADVFWVLSGFIRNYPQWWNPQALVYPEDDREKLYRSHKKLISKWFIWAVPLHNLNTPVVREWLFADI